MGLVLAAVVAVACSGLGVGALPGAYTWNLYKRWVSCCVGKNGCRNINMVVALVTLSISPRVLMLAALVSLGQVLFSVSVGQVL